MHDSPWLKLLSGRFWLTIIAGLVFAWLSYAGTLEPQAITAIIISVFTSYFHRTDRGTPTPN